MFSTESAMVECCELCYVRKWRGLYLFERTTKVFARSRQYHHPSSSAIWVIVRIECFLICPALLTAHLRSTCAMATIMCISPTSSIGAIAGPLIASMSPALAVGLVQACATLPQNSFTTVYFQLNVQQCAVASTIVSMCAPLAGAFIKGFSCSTNGSTGENRPRASIRVHKSRALPSLQGDGHSMGLFFCEQVAVSRESCRLILHGLAAERSDLGPLQAPPSCPAWPRRPGTTAPW